MHTLKSCVQPTLVAIMGPTASGKTALAESLALETGWQLINADAFQVYRGMDIGTAKSSTPERYRLMDICEPNEAFGVGAWIRLAVQELEVLYALGQSAIVVGGSLHYIRALFEEFQDLHDAPDPALRVALNARELEDLAEELTRKDPATQVDLKNKVRVQRALERIDLPKLSFTLPPFRKLKFGLMPESKPNAIHARVQQMVAAGWVDEVRELKSRGIGRDDPGMRAHGYRAMWDVLHEVKSLDQAIKETALEVTQYAKRQRTWLRREPNLVKLEADGGSTLAAIRIALGVS